MSLDGFGRCACIRDGKARPHPFPDRLIFDESGEPTLTGDPSEEKGEAHGRGLGESCKHERYPLSLFLGNITRLASCEAFCSTSRALPDRDFRILPEKVLYDGTHTGDWISSKIAEKLLKEVDAVLHSSDILADSDKVFFNNMKLLCEASVATGNPVMF
jgi:hypothetical protein